MNSHHHLTIISRFRLCLFYPKLILTILPLFLSFHVLVLWCDCWGPYGGGFSFFGDTTSPFPFATRAGTSVVSTLSGDSGCAIALPIIFWCVLSPSTLIPFCFIIAPFLLVWFFSRRPLSVCHPLLRFSKWACPVLLETFPPLPFFACASSARRVCWELSPPCFYLLRFFLWGCGRWFAFLFTTGIVTIVGTTGLFFLSSVSGAALEGEFWYRQNVDLGKLERDMA